MKQRNGQAPPLPEPPDLLTPVSLRIERLGEPVVEIDTRVWDVESRALESWSVLVARPDLANGMAHPTPGPGERVVLSWVTPSGVLRLAVRVSAAERSFGSVWVLLPMGAATREQRRAYFRVRMAAPLTLHLPDEVESDETEVESTGSVGSDSSGAPSVDGVRTVQVRGTLVDLGEGGLFAATGQPGPSVGTTLEVDLDLDDGPIRPCAQVVRTVALPGGNRGVALQFTDPDRFGPTLRRTLLRVQRQRARER